MAVLTDEQKEKYRKHFGCRCPCCGSGDLLADHGALEQDESGIRMVVQCETCGRAWKDVYELVDVEEVDEEETDAEADQAEVPGDLAEPLTPAEVSEDRKETLF
jgi:uncharacterized Zn finger protein